MRGRAITAGHADEWRSLVIADGGGVVDVRLGLSDVAAEFEHLLVVAIAAGVKQPEAHRRAGGRGEDWRLRVAACQCVGDVLAGVEAGEVDPGESLEIGELETAPVR